MAEGVAFIGAGNMGGALIEGVVRDGMCAAEEVWAVDVRTERLAELGERFGVRTTSDYAAALEGCRWVVLAVKPQQLPRVLERLRPWARKRGFVSIAAGVRLSFLEARLGEGVALVRAMPNMPAQVGAGVTAISPGRYAGPEEMDFARRLFACVGEVVEVAEGLLDAVTALSGSGPAYVAVMIEALADAGVREGLPREVAVILAVRTVLGAARLIEARRLHPAQLKDLVASPGGTTAAGLAALETAGFRGGVWAAVAAATRRARELGEAASGEEKVKD